MKKNKGIEWLLDVLHGAGIGLIRIEPQLFEEACQIYGRFADKEWSFTDCTSYAAMQRLGITKAFSFDSHFRQFGVAQVFP